MNPEYIQEVLEEKVAAESSCKGHSDHSDNKDILKKLLIVLLLAGLFMVLEIIGGIIAGSVAILSDAAHMLSDLLGFVISIASVYISGMPANKKHSYGFHRAGVIGAMASVLVIWILTGFLIYFAIVRIINIDQVEVEGKVMFAVACFGLLTNLVMIKVLHGDHDHGDHDHSHGFGHSHGHHHHNHHGHSHSHSHKHVHNHKHEEKHKHEHNHGHKHEEHDHHHHHDHNHGHEDHKHDDHDHYHHDHDHKHEHRHDGECQHAHENLSRQGEVKLIVSEKDITHSGSPQKKNLSKVSHKDNLNVRATVIHIIGDILQSIGVIIASIIIWISPEKMKIVDPLMTIIFAVIVFYTTIGVAKDCVFVLMEGTPKELKLEEFEEELKLLSGVTDVHDLHVWSLGVGMPAMSAHIFTSNEMGPVLKLTTDLCRKYGILHSTIQVEITQDKEHQDYIDCKHNIH